MPNSSPPQPHVQAPPEPFALLLWVAINSISLFLSAARWNLWPAAPKPPESSAAIQLLVIDAIAVALFFPILLSNGRRTILTALTIAPFLQIAGFLGGVSHPRLIAAYFCLIVWIATLYAWRTAFPGRRGQMFLMTVGTSWSMGLPLISYFYEDFFLTGAADSAGRSIADFGPLSILTSPLSGQVPNIFAITLLGTFFIAGTITAILKNRRIKSTTAARPHC